MADKSYIVTPEAYIVTPFSPESGVVDSVTGGAGISVSPTTGNVVVTNTGVLSLNALNGVVALTSTGGTITITPGLGGYIDIEAAAGAGPFVQTNPASAQTGVAVNLVGGLQWTPTGFPASNYLFFGLGGAGGAPNVQMGDDSVAAFATSIFGGESGGVSIYTGGANPIAILLQNSVTFGTNSSAYALSINNTTNLVKTAGTLGALYTTTVGTGGTILQAYSTNVVILAESGNQLSLDTNASFGSILLGGKGEPIYTSNNTLDDGSGNVTAAGYLQVSGSYIALGSSTTTGYVLTANSSGHGTWQAIPASTSIAWSSLTTPTANLTLSMSTYTTTMALAANTASAWQFTDGTNPYLVINTQTSTAGIAALTLEGTAPTIASGTANPYMGIYDPGFILTLTGTSSTATVHGLQYFMGQPTITDTSSLTIPIASALYLAGGPISGGSITITHPYAMFVDNSGNLGMWSPAATSGTTTVNSGMVDLIGAYWSGSANVPYGFRIYTDLTATTPNANLMIELYNNGTISQMANLTQNGIWQVLDYVTTKFNTTITASANLYTAFSNPLAVISTDANKYLALDINGSFGGVGIETLSSGITLASAAGLTFSTLFTSAGTLTLSGSTNVTALNGMGLKIGQPTIAASSAITVTTASSLYIAGAPVAGTDITITNNYMINTSVSGCFLTAAGTWTSASSRSLKEAIVPIDYASTLSDLKALDPVRYRYRQGDTGALRYGLIAEDVPSFLASSDRRGIGDIFLAGFAVSAVRALYDVVETDSERITRLEGKVAAYEAKFGPLN